MKVIVALVEMLFVAVGVAACNRADSSEPRAAASAAEVHSRDAQFLSELEAKLPAAAVAFGALTECASSDERYRTSQCTATGREALRLASEVSRLARDADVSPSLEPLRAKTESSWGMLAAAVGHAARYFQHGERDGARRADQLMPVALAAVAEAKSLWQQARSGHPGGTTVGEIDAPSRGQVQRDLDTLVKSQQSKRENVFLDSVRRDTYELDVAVAEVRGEILLAGEWERWKGLLTYRKAQGFWRLEKAASCVTPYGAEFDDKWTCDYARRW